MQNFHLNEVSGQGCIYYFFSLPTSGGVFVYRYSFMADKPINFNIKSLIIFVVFPKICINQFPQAAFGPISHTET